MAKQVTLQAACGWYGITRQAHNQMRQRQAERKRIETLILTEVHRIRRDLPRLGGRKLLVKLAPFLEEEGLSIGRDRFFDLLRRHDLLVPVKRKPARTTFPGGVRSENLLASATITGPNQAVVADITYIETEEGFLYLALVTDLYSRKIIGWDLSDSLSLEGAVRAMKRAIQHIRAAGGDTAGMIHHSDHGSQYTSRPYLALLAQAGIRSSMGAVGNAYDNAVAERVNGILKLEFMLDHRFSNPTIARRAVANAIRLYNTERPHLSLDYATPAEVYARQQRVGKAAIAELETKALAPSRGGAAGPDSLQPLTGASFRIPSAPAALPPVLLL